MLYRRRDPRLTTDSAATQETERRDHDFCLSRSHYTDNDPSSRARAATAGIEPRNSSPGVARSTDLAPFLIYGSQVLTILRAVAISMHCLRCICQSTQICKAKYPRMIESHRCCTSNTLLLSSVAGCTSNTLLLSSVAGCTSNTLLLSSVAGCTSNTLLLSSVAGCTSNTLLLSSVAGCTSNTLLLSSVAGCTSNTLLLSSVAGCTSNTLLLSSVAGCTSNTLLLSSVAGCTSNTLLLSSVAGCTSNTLLLSSVAGCTSNTLLLSSVAGCTSNTLLLSSVAGVTGTRIGFKESNDALICPDPDRKCGPVCLEMSLICFRMRRASRKVKRKGIVKQFQVHRQWVEALNLSKS